MVLSAKKSDTVGRYTLPDYHMHSQQLTLTDNMTYLGIMIAKKLTWNVHIKKVVSKANKHLWLCIRTLGFNAETKPKTICYMAMVCSILGYGSVIWSPTYKFLIIMVESIQRQATNYIVSNPRRPHPRHLDYKTRLIQLNLLPLTYRREIIDIQFFLKIWNSHCNCNIDKYLSFVGTDSRWTTRATALNIDLKYKKTKLITTAHFFPYKLCQIWNKLPPELRLSLKQETDKEKIKKLLVPYYTKRLHEVFDSDNTCSWVHSCDCGRCRPA